MTGFLTVSGEAERTEIIERSKFICNIKHIESEEQAREFIAEIKKKHSRANHHCYAFIADERASVCRFSDDGEPQGTAGMPILNALKSNGIFMAVAVVTRYFGGIKLGTGGLARAYGGITAECLKSAKTVFMQPAAIYKITADYEQYVKFLNKKLAVDFEITGAEFFGKVKFTAAVKLAGGGKDDGFPKLVNEVTSGNCCIEKLTEKYYCFKV